MSDWNKTTGNLGEELAVKYLSQKGMQLLNATGGFVMRKWILLLR
jgi:hypothetical protein